jgi:hypothetical protein
VSGSPPTLYEWAGGMPAFERLTHPFYDEVLQDDLLEPLFRGMDENHPSHSQTGRIAAARSPRAALGLGRGAPVHRLEARDMADREAGGRARLGLPARARTALSARVEAQASHNHEDVAGVGVDGDPAAAPGCPVVHEQA